jgi:predicted Zn-dependent protease
MPDQKRTMETKPLRQNSPNSKLTQNERDSLFFLVYLYMRIGKTDHAQLILEGMEKSCPEEERTGKYLAAIALDQEDGQKALAHLNSYLDRSEIKSKDAPLLLMQAKALWIQGQETESRNIISEYLMMAGE